MCLLLFAVDSHPKYRLVVAANRDEYYHRATEPAHFWEDNPNLLAGRDLERGGAWLGITRTGRWAALTNYRERNTAHYANSRGHIVRDYLTSDLSPGAFARDLIQEVDEFAGFNLVVGNGREFLYYSNRGGDPCLLSKGIYGLSNQLLDTPWPKLTHGKSELEKAIADGIDIDVDRLFTILAHQDIAADEDLPDTGVGIEQERLLSPPFITSPAYGTRSSTVILVNQANCVELTERSFLWAAGDGLRSPKRYTTVVHKFTEQRL